MKGDCCQWFSSAKGFKHDSEILQQNPLNNSKTVEDFLGQVQGWEALTQLLMYPQNSREQSLRTMRIAFLPSFSNLEMPYTGHL